MSANIIYTSIPQILGSCTSLKQQLDLMDAILVNMLIALNNATVNREFTEYKIDTGQTKTEIKYTTIPELQLAYDRLFKTKQIVLAQFNAGRQGRVASLVSAKNFIGFWPVGYGW